MSPRRLSAGRPRRGEAGFSLLEAMVAVALVGLLSLVLVETARFSRLGYARSLESSDALRDTGETRRLLTGLIERAEPMTLEDQNGDRALFFDGGPDRLTLLAPYSALGLPRHRALAALAARPGLAVFSIGLEPLEGEGTGGSTRGLVLRHAPLAPASEPGRALATERPLLLGPAEALAFRYFGPEGDDEDEQAWRESWRLRRAAPVAVSAAIAGGGFEASAPLVARPLRRVETF